MFVPGPEAEGESREMMTFLILLEAVNLFYDSLSLDSLGQLQVGRDLMRGNASVVQSKREGTAWAIVLTLGRPKKKRDFEAQPVYCEEERDLMANHVPEGPEKMTMKMACVNHALQTTEAVGSLY